jgi:hypothetical protein
MSAHHTLEVTDTTQGPRQVLVMEAGGSRYIDIDDPETGETVETITATGNPGGTLILENNLWWTEDRSMYVYWIPKWWRYL